MCSESREVRVGAHTRTVALLPLALREWNGREVDGGEVDGGEVGVSSSVLGDEATKSVAQVVE